MTVNSYIIEVLTHGCPMFMSYRDIEEIMKERGFDETYIKVKGSLNLCWVSRISSVHRKPWLQSESLEATEPLEFTPMLL